MIDVSLPENNHLLTVFHQPVGILIHAVHQDIVFQALLHLCDIDDFPLREFLKFLVVDIRTVEGHNLFMAEMSVSEHERVICRRGGKLDIKVYALIGMNDGMNLDAFLLLPCLGMPTHTLENYVGEQCYGGGVNDSQPFHPFLRAITTAVRRKLLLV